MASISFRTPEKMNDENKPLPGTPRTPNSHKIQDLGRTSSQKRARQIFDSLRSLKSRGKHSNDAEEEDAQSAENGSPVRRRNSTWDLFGNIRSRKSNDFGIPENERPLTTTPLKLEPEINQISELLPKRRKSLINILGSISNMASPRRVANSREKPLDEEALPAYCEEDVFAEKLVKELIDLNLDSLNRTHASTSDGHSTFLDERLSGLCSLKADHNKIIDNFKIQQLEDLLNDQDGYEAKSWTSQAQTLQNDGFSEQLASQTPTTDGDRSKTPDSYLCSIIKSFDDYNSEPTVLKEGGAMVSPSPSPGKLLPTQPIDFLKDLSPDVIPNCQSDQGNQFIDTTSSIVFYADKPEPFEKIYREEKRPIITIREITSDSDFSFAYEDPIAPSPPTWQDAAKSRNSMLKSKARLPDQDSAPYVQEVEPLFVNQREKRKIHWQGSEPTPFITEELDQQNLLPTHTKERKDQFENSIEPLSVNLTEEQKIQGQSPSSNSFSAEESDLQRIARSIKQTVDKMTKNLYLSSLSEETTEEWEDELPEIENYPSELEYKYGLFYDENLDSLTQTVEDPYTKTREKIPTGKMISKNISSFKDMELFVGPIFVRYPQSDGSWSHVQYFPTGSLALSEIRKRNQGEYSDTITYCPEESCIYVHLWGKLPKLETDLRVRVIYPETKTQGARTQIYDNGDLAIADMAQQNLGASSEIRYNLFERCFQVYTSDDVESPNCSIRVDYPETKTRSSRTQIYNKKNLAMTDICQQSHGEFSEVRYNLSERHFRVFTWGEDIDSSDRYIHVDFKEPETERNVHADHNETKTRCATRQSYETEDFATAEIDRITNDEFSRFVYRSPDRSFCVEAQPEVFEQPFRAREPAWRPTLSPLGDRDEDEQDLPDFSDLEDDFQVVVTESLRSLSPGIQSQEGVGELIGDDNSGGNDMSLCVEAGTPRKAENEFVAELFMGNECGNYTPLLRGSKQILQYLDSLDSRDSTGKILNTEADLQSDRRTATKAWAESRSTNKTPQASRDRVDEPLAQVSCSNYHEDHSDNETASIGIEIFEVGSRENSNAFSTPGYQLSNADIFGEDMKCGVSIVHEVSEDSRESTDSNVNENVMFDLGRDVVHGRERSNAICGENIIPPLFKEMLNIEGPPVRMSSGKSIESLYILPIDNIDLYEENAGCGDPKRSCSTQLDENIATFSTDVDLTMCVPRPIDQSPKSINATIPTYKIDTHLWSANLTESDVEGGTDQTGFGAGLDFERQPPFENIHTVPGCTSSSAYGQSSLEISTVSASNMEHVKHSVIDEGDTRDFLPKKTKAGDTALLVEAVSHEYIDNEVSPLTTVNDHSTRIPTLVNIFHSRGMMSPTISPASSRPFLNRCSSPIQITTSPKRGENLTPRIVTPSGKVYSPAKEEQDISNPIQRVQTPGTSLGDYINKGMSGDETDISDGFGEELEKMGVRNYSSRDSNGSISLDESDSD
ncbi:hypothetical protein EYC80_006405 [Monilinia laxa]|uniref:Uncharacterized protein n=1 Tax=Monilinia laxa TaxID=61186 RepID=A0A5N6JSL4_MONLA|nr:hypothetical protein EYC80_006405 [Monilinia laxa]